ncbi:MAG: 2-phospho-L-lactate guanylyltransferase [Pseudomonadota bacterium]
MSGQKILVAVPVKDPDHAKGRLRGYLSDRARKYLAKRLLDQLLCRLACARTKLTGIEADIALVTVPGAAWVGADPDVIVIEEAAPGLNAAAATALDWARRNDYDGLCLLPGDLADPSVEDLAELLGQSMSRSSAFICPSQDFGTNALLVPTNTEMVFAYGPRSYYQHAGRARDAGLHVSLVPFPSLRRDIDRPTDLQHLSASIRYTIANDLLTHDTRDARGHR